MIRLFLGWDVGAWHCDKNPNSRDALWLLTSDGGALKSLGVSHPRNLREALSDQSGRPLLEAMARLCGHTPNPDDEIWVAIDTPLGWPTDFRELLEGKAPASVAKKYRENRLIFRQTDRWISAQGGLLGGRQTPLSPVQDQIGSQSTKGLLFLSRVGARITETGVWRGEGVTVIEAYPTPCRQCTSVKDLVNRILPAELARQELSDDQKDALTCALIAWLFAEHRDWLHEPPVGVDSLEGWIWIPKSDVPNHPAGDTV